MLRTTLLLGLLSLSPSLWACGTIKMWHQRYFEAISDTDRLNALKFLHCEPVVKQYKGHEEDLKLLLEVVENALIRSQTGSEHAEEYRLLAVKNYMVFGLFGIGDAVVQHTLVQDRVAKALGVEYFPFDASFRERTNSFSPIFYPFTDFFTTPDYIARVEQQVNMLMRSTKEKQSVAFTTIFNDAGEELNIRVTGTTDKFLNLLYPTEIQLAGAVEQTLSLPEDCVCEWPEDQVKGLVRTEDLNFDGYLDLMAFNNAGATGNRWYPIWIYDPILQEYYWDEFLSELPGWSIDHENQTLTSFETQGYCAQSWSTYAWFDEMWVETQRAYTALNDSSVCERIEGNVTSGEFVETSRAPYSSGQR
ncbi:MAG: hypothetical protein AAFQ98_00710 [Bacteroidota bacterium]